MSTTVDPWQLVDEWQLEEGPDGEVDGDPYFKIAATTVAELNMGRHLVQKPINSSAEQVTTIKICALCGGEVPGGGILRICTPCWNTLTSEPKVHLRLEGSDKDSQGVVVWDHNSIGAEPHDKNPVPVGVWGKYGVEGTPLTYWVSLCKPIEAIHDMMTQFNAAIRDEQALFRAQIIYSKATIDESGTGYKSTYKPRSRSTKQVEAPKQPEVPISAADKLKNFLGR